MSKKSTRGSSATKTKHFHFRINKKKRFTFFLLLTAILAILFLFIINGLCLTGQGLSNSLIICSSCAIIIATVLSLFMRSWIDIVIAYEC